MLCGQVLLTIALPVLSAAGVSCSILPTAVMSTHTGGFRNVHGRDLTEDILAIVRHWKREGLSFDALYSGYLYSSAQVETVKTAISLLRATAMPPLLMVDPAMGDGERCIVSVPPTWWKKWRICVHRRI